MATCYTFRDQNEYYPNSFLALGGTCIIFGRRKWQFSNVLESWREISTKQFWKKSFTVTI